MMLFKSPVMTMTETQPPYRVHHWLSNLVTILSELPILPDPTGDSLKFNQSGHTNLKAA